MRDLQAATAFYKLIARHTGLRDGRRWDGGVQFRGAWGTFQYLLRERLVEEGATVEPDGSVIE